MHIVLNKKYNTYQPFLIDGMTDFCEMMRTDPSKNAIFNMIFKIFGNSTNMFHKCPALKGEVIVINDMLINPEAFPPVPTGRYRLDAKMWKDKEKTLLYASGQLYISVQEMQGLFMVFDRPNEKQ